MGEESSVTTKKDSSRKSTDVSKLCVVCGDKSAGRHYRVFTCEGCKVFFGRTSRKKRKMVCSKNFKCKISKKTRTMCIPCRYRACVNAGMVHEGLKLVIEEPVSSKKNLCFDMDFIDSLVDVYKSTHVALDLSTKNTLVGLSKIEEIGETGRLWAAQFIKMISGSWEKTAEENGQSEGVAMKDIMILRLASRFAPELKGFLFQPGSLVSLVDITKSLGRNLSRKLLFVATFLVFMNIDDYELSLMYAILATMKKPETSMEFASANNDDLRSHLTTLHNYELTKRSWSTNMSYKLLKILQLVHDVSLKEEGRLLVKSHLEGEVMEREKTHTHDASLEVADLLAKDLLQGCSNPSQSNSQDLINSSNGFSQDLQRSFQSSLATDASLNLEDTQFFNLTNQPWYQHSQKTINDSHKGYIQSQLPPDVDIHVQSTIPFHPNPLCTSSLSCIYPKLQTNAIDKYPKYYNDHTIKCSEFLAHNASSALQNPSWTISNYRPYSHEAQPSQPWLPVNSGVPPMAAPSVSSQPRILNDRPNDPKPRDSFTPFMIGEHHAFFHK